MDIAKLTALKAARFRRAEATAEIPLSQGDLDNRMLDAASVGRTEALARWIALGANPRARDTAGFTALMSASFAGCLDCAALLLPISEVSDIDAAGRNALDLAQRAGHAKVVEAIRAFELSLHERRVIDECSPPLPQGPSVPSRRLGL